MEAHCIVCGDVFEAKRSTARYCGPTCRQRAHRLGIATPREPLIVARVEPVAVPLRQRKPSTDDLARLFLDAIALEASFRFASERADFRFRPMCTRIADALSAAIEKEGIS